MDTKHSKLEKSVLIIEDDELLNASMATALVGAGYSPMNVTGLREANFKLRNQKFQCILLDIRLGSDNGLDIIELLRKHKQTPNADTPIIVISGFLETELVKSIAVHIQGALVKPFDPKQLLERVQKVFDK